MNEKMVRLSTREGPAPRPEFARAKPYKVPKFKAQVKLNSNESPFPLPQPVLQEIRRTASEMSYNRYPDPQARELRGAISQAYGVGTEMILVGNGSNEVLMSAFHAFGGPGRKMVDFKPSYLMTDVYACLSGTALFTLERDENYLLTTGIIAKAVSAAPEIVYIVNPNNPTGTWIDMEIIEQLSKDLPQTLVVVDEAYGEFADDSAIRLIERYKNVVVARTLSKAFSLAGLRVGYLIGNREVIDSIKRAMLPYNLNAFSQAAAALVMRHRESIYNQTEVIKSERDSLYRRMKGFPGIEVYPSKANFLWFRPLKMTGQEVFEKLLEKEVLVRSFAGDPLTPDFLRVTVGKPEESERFFDALEAIIGN